MTKCTYKVPNIALLWVLHEGGSNIPALIHDTGIPDNTCCRFLFWGTCTKPGCKLNHDATALTPEATTRTVTILQQGITKLTAKN